MYRQEEQQIPRAEMIEAVKKAIEKYYVDLKNGEVVFKSAEGEKDNEQEAEGDAKKERGDRRKGREKKWFTLLSLCMNTVLFVCI